LKIRKCKIQNQKERLLLHACCGPCLSSVYETLARKEYEISVIWYNPNIEPEEEYQKRLLELKRYCQIENIPLLIPEIDYANENLLWKKSISGLENEPEGGNRCKKCIDFRLKRIADFADMQKYEKVSTTLSVSPHKNAKIINSIGENIYKEKFLQRDFKKKNGYLKSIQLSKKYKLYRQNYCGCLFGKKV